MKNLIYAVAAALAVTTSLHAAVWPEAGKRNESLGTQWDRAGITSWMSRGDALVTPEATNYSLQWCLRSSQERLDEDAYAVGARITRTLDTHFNQAPARGPFESGLAALTEVLVRIETLPKASSPQEYEGLCNQVVGTELQKSRGALAVMFERRMNPHVPPELARKGIQLAPLTWDGLQESICKLEGYYSTSHDPRLWKFFSTTRTMANVLPADNRTEEFATVVRALPPRVLEDIRTLDNYSAVAGRVNGATLSMSAEELKAAPMRLTGVALGSRSPSLMAFFTTGWREGLQDLILKRNYPGEAFKLLRVDEILSSLERTAFEVKAGGRLISQTEHGMGMLWETLRPGASGDYGPVTNEYRRTAALAWLALNAETNIRQNEKLAAVVTSAPAEPEVSGYGAPEHYGRLGTQIEAALTAYRALGQAVIQKVPYCVSSMHELSKTLARIPQGEIARLPRGSARALDQHYEPVIADLGGEVVDPADGPFKLHLATGYGRSVPTTIGKGTYRLWTPGAHSLHLPKTVSTAEWRGGQLSQYEP